jgi:GGDEF domain-containing protein
VRRVSSWEMDKLAIGFWGCYFGTTALMLAGSALAYMRSLRRISLNAAMSALASAFFVVAFLGYLPISGAETLARFLAHLTVLTAALLIYLLFAMLGVVSSPATRSRAIFWLWVLCVAVMGVGWWLVPLQSLVLSLAVALLLGVFALLLCLRGALRGDRLAWAAVWGVFCMLVAMSGLGLIALDRQHAPWQAHVVSAVAATLYLATMASVLWARYSYLLELHEVLIHGPSYDPITRMRSHTETSQMVGAVFKKIRDQPAPLGVLVLTVINFYSLDRLHGQAAVNHALFICSSRLRRVVPANVEMGRLGADGFVLIMRNCKDSGNLIDLARQVSSRLGRPLSLNTSGNVARLESQNTIWAAEVGVGVLMVSNPEMKGSRAIATALGMSRTAMSYASRLAWFDHSSGEIVELPILPSE